MNNDIFSLINIANKKTLFSSVFCIVGSCCILINFICLCGGAFFIRGVVAYMVAHHLVNYNFGLTPRAFYGATIGELTQNHATSIVFSSLFFPVFWNVSTIIVN